jgi:hypothetical protein
MAIQTILRTGTAYENLGDIYAKLASQAYDKAMQLDKANTTAPASSPRSAARSRAQPPGAAAPAIAAASEASRCPLHAARHREADPRSRRAMRAVRSRPSAPAPAAGESAAVLQAVNAWASAWSSRNLDGYLDAYSKSFAPEGKSRDEWERAAHQFPATRRSQVSIEQPRSA